MNWWPIADGGLMGPMSLIPQASNGHEATVGWNNSRGWCMKSAWVWQVLHRFAYCPSLMIIVANNSQVCAVSPRASGPANGHHICYHELLWILLVPLNWIDIREVHHRMSNSKVSLPQIIVEMRGSSSNRSPFFRIIGQYIMQDIVNDRESPTPRFEGCWGCMNFANL